MNYYQILGVQRNASQNEIKDVYRKLVKQHHPDKNTSIDTTEIIAQVNEAYDVLSNPEKRAAYDNRYTSFTEILAQEDPREIAKRDYIKRKREEAIRGKERTETLRKQLFFVFRWLSFPILLFAVILLLDDYLPRKAFKEIALAGWQERRDGYRGYSRYRGIIATDGELYSFMKTKRFEFVVPDEVHLNYDYYENQDTLDIETTPIFNVIKTISIENDNIVKMWPNYRGRGHLIPWQYLLFISAAFTSIRRKYTLITYSLCFLPVLLLALTLFYYL